ncbi:MAG: 3-hydroxyacyl-CoA dehydrogenase NAD-binding domain-containing protein [Coriobacteriia bacterium]|nr:3-hydroxyacyl-CoA dehydrogenase NAD-binding domain-containing protein [Coriobacteriia bacterium]
MITCSCPSCNRRYSYPVIECTFCRVPLVEQETRTGEVVGVTEVSVPSLGHEEVPYWCALVARPQGGFAVVKRDVPTSVGDRITFGVAEETATHTIGVVGSGVMARGLVELFLARGQRVTWVGRSLERLSTARDKVVDRLARVMDEEQLSSAVSRLELSENASAFASCDLVLEAVVEEVEPKLAILREIEAAVGPECMIATNTSSLPLDVLASALSDASRFGGMHFFNPPTRMRLVELVRAPETSDETDGFLYDLSVSLGKIPVRVANGPGFVVNRVLMPLLNEAVRALEDNAAPAADIDEAVRLGLNHPMGPLALADLIGLDVVVSIMEDLHARLGDDAYAPRPMLSELVNAGKLGRKTGSGFYDYTPPPAP